jgi:hypothetical protein
VSASVMIDLNCFSVIRVNDRSTPRMSAESKLASEECPPQPKRFSSYFHPQNGLVSVESLPTNSHSNKVAPRKSAPSNSAPLNTVRVRSAFLKLALFKEA